MTAPTLTHFHRYTLRLIRADGTTYETPAASRRRAAERVSFLLEALPSYDGKTPSAELWRTDAEKPKLTASWHGERSPKNGAIVAVLDKKAREYGDAR